LVKAIPLCRELRAELGHLVGAQADRTLQAVLAVVRVLIRLAHAFQEGGELRQSGDCLETVLAKLAAQARVHFATERHVRRNLKPAVPHFGHVLR
jgi:hypothetical protein